MDLRVEDALRPLPRGIESTIFSAFPPPRVELESRTFNRRARCYCSTRRGGSMDEEMEFDYTRLVRLIQPRLLDRDDI